MADTLNERFERLKARAWGAGIDVYEDLEGGPNMRDAIVYLAGALGMPEPFDALLLDVDLDALFDGRFVED